MIIKLDLIVAINLILSLKLFISQFVFAFNENILELSSQKQTTHEIYQQLLQEAGYLYYKLFQLYIKARNISIDQNLIVINSQMGKKYIEVENRSRIYKLFQLDLKVIRCFKPTKIPKIPKFQVDTESEDNRLEDSLLRKKSMATTIES